MSNQVTLTGRAELDAIFQSLKRVSDEGAKASKVIARMGDDTNKALESGSKKTMNSIKATGSVLRRLASQLFSDFKGLISLGTVAGGLKLTSQFAGSVKESMKLSDTIRRLGSSFGIARHQFGAFQAAMAKGLGDIGLSSEAAADALQGLAGLGVKGSTSAMNLAKGSAALASISGENGNEGNIANLLGRALRSSGANINDAGAQNKLISEVNAAVMATGKPASELLGAMEEIMSHLDKSLKGKIGPQAMGQMGVLATTVGPMATKALEEYLGKSPIERKAMEAQGVKFFDKGGNLDMNAIMSFIKAGSSRVPGDPRMGMKTMGFSDDAAEGLVRLGENSELVSTNLKTLQGASRDYVDTLNKTRGIFDSLSGAVNTVKGNLEQWFQGLSQGLTHFLSNQVGSKAGSAAVVAGGATLAAVATAWGMKNIGKMVTGAKGIAGALDVQKVFVVNMGGGLTGGPDGLLDLPGGVGKKKMGLGGMLGAAGKTLGAGALGYEVGANVVNPLLDNYTQGKTDEGFEGNAIERMFFKMNKAFDGNATKNFQAPVKVEVITKEPNLKTVTQPSRGRGSN